MADGAADDASPPKRLKKLPFKPTALRKTSLPKLASSDDNDKHGGGGGGGTNKDDDDGLALFRRAKEMEPIVTAEHERRLKKKQREEEKKRRAAIKLGKRPLQEVASDNHLDHVPHDDGQAWDHGSHSREPLSTAESGDGLGPSSGGLEKSTTVDKDIFSDLVTPPASKRSRIESTPTRTPIPTFEEAGDVAVDSPSTRVLRSNRKAATPIKSSPQKAAAPRTNDNVIAIESDSDSEAAFATPSRRRRRSSSGVVVVDDSPALLAPDEEDAEFEEYVRKAEAQRARDQAMLDSGADTGTPPTKDQVEIVVMSKVANTVSFRARVLYTKPLRLVRDTWMAMQRQKGVSLPVQNADDIILTWRRKRVYITSTLLHLGIRPRHGRVWVDGNGRDGLMDDGTRVLMEAWTPELFQDMEREEEHRRRREAGELSDDDEIADEEPPAPEIKLRVILVAKGMEEVKLTVRPETTVETLVTGFRTQRDVGSDKELRVRFDGEWLDEHVTMEEADVDDMNKFEIHFK
ncbi:hypothetical protein JDV02_001356 [Purpureocillium takamizusanense]|uniref:Ubiquitin-like domain-containing protein n=1 Tax=Purpureocillium takamizusanense TaxID=2060973 RepID=A0A9Q8Q917_9HYPO|nr:uncharacterized protein JDV02_001356 [Purpureocillium takamizusanense]UNI14758.1 hypothetical protein JDV02_001356 [Purpureocillium takamizusanense]